MFTVEIIFVGGGSASGKTKICNELEKCAKSKGKNVIKISLDSWYKSLHKDDLEKVKKGNYNFDNPDALNWDLIITAIQNLIAGKPAHIPKYSFTTHQTEGCSILKLEKSREYISVIEGIHGLNDLLLQFNGYRLFIDASDKTRYERRLKRDIAERGRTEESVKIQYDKYVRPAYNDHVKKTRRNADKIIENEHDDPSWPPKSLLDEILAQLETAT